MSLLVEVEKEIVEENIKDHKLTIKYYIFETEKKKKAYEEAKEKLNRLVNMVTAAYVASEFYKNHNRNGY